MATHRSLSTDDAVDAATTPGRFRTLLQRGTNTGACICTLQHVLAHAHKLAHTHKHAAMTPGPFHTLLQTRTQRYLNMHTVHSAFIIFTDSKNGTSDPKTTVNIHSVPSYSGNRNKSIFSY